MATEDERLDVIEFVQGGVLGRLVALVNELELHAVGEARSGPDQLGVAGDADGLMVLGVTLGLTVLENRTGVAVAV